MSSLIVKSSHQEIVSYKNSSKFIVIHISTLEQKKILGLWKRSFEKVIPQRKWSKEHKGPIYFQSF